MAGSVNKVILGRQSGRRPGGPPHPGRPPDRQSAGRDLGELARQEYRRAAREDRMASRRHLQRGSRQDRRAVPQERLEGLSRRRAADAQMAGQGRPGPLLDRGRAAGLQLGADDARSRRRRSRGRQWRLRLGRPDRVTRAQAGDGRRRRQARRHGRRDSVLASLGVSPLSAHPRESGGPGRQFLICNCFWIPAIGARKHAVLRRPTHGGFTGKFP